MDPQAGLTLQFLAWQEYSTRLRIISSVVMALVVWDWFSLLPSEIKVYRHTKSARTLGLWAFLVLRISPFVAVVPEWVLANFNVASCQAASSVSAAGAALVQISSSLVFLLRTLSLLREPRRETWLSHKPALAGVRAVLVSVWLINAGLWIATTPGYHFQTSPPTLYGSNCVNPDNYSWTAAIYLTSTLFDVLVMLVTTAWHYKTKRAISDKDSVMHEISGRMLSDSTIYFSAMTIANLVALSVSLSKLQFAYQRAYVSGFVTLVAASMGQRTFLRLRLRGIALATGGGAGRSFGGGSGFYLPSSSFADDRSKPSFQSRRGTSSSSSSMRIVVPPAPGPPSKSVRDEAVTPVSRATLPPPTPYDAGAPRTPRPSAPGLPTLWTASAPRDPATPPSSRTPAPAPPSPWTSATPSVVHHDRIIM